MKTALCTASSVFSRSEDSSKNTQNYATLKPCAPTLPRWTKVEAKERKTTSRDDASAFVKEKYHKKGSYGMKAGENERA